MPLKGLQLGQTKSASLVALSFFLVFLLVIASIAIFSIKAATDQATATATAQQIATDTAANPNPYPPYRGALVLDDPLSDNTKGYQWEEYKYTPTAGSGCEFTGGAYHVIESQADYNNCNANATTFSTTLPFRCR